MAEGAWALIGVGVGAAGGGLIQVAQAGLQHRWDRRQKGVERLFDRRYDAHVAFMKAATEVMSEFRKWAITPDYELPEFSSHERAFELIELYGSDDWVRRARARRDHWNESFWDSMRRRGGDVGLERWVRYEGWKIKDDELRVAYQRAARRDLGVGD